MKKLIALALGLLISVSAVGCVGGSRDNITNKDTEIEISFWDSGYGKEYMKQIIDEFKIMHPDYDIIFRPDESGAGFTHPLQKGKNDTTDLYFGTLDALNGYQDMFAPLDDVYEMVADGETTPIGDKFQDSLKAAMINPDGHYYALSYAGSVGGLMYNAKILDGKNYKVPNTTDDLQVLALTLANNDIPAFIHFQDRSLAYYQYIVTAWQVQYSGLDEYMNRWVKCADEDGNSPDMDTWLSETDGRLQALKVLEKIITPDTVYRGSNTEEIGTQQTLFLNNRAAMMPNGAWLENEMAGAIAPDMQLRLMKTPVISSIREVLPDKSVKNDAELSALITYIDSVSSGEVAAPTGDTVTGTGFEVTKADYDRVYTARNQMYGNQDLHGVILNKYSTAKEAAKEFLRFVFSDRGGQIFAEHIHQLPSFTLEDPDLIEPDDTWSDFQLQCLELQPQLEIISYGGYQRSPIMLLNSLNQYMNLGIISSLCAINESDRGDAKSLWADVQQTVRDKWKDWLFNAGY